MAVTDRWFPRELSQEVPPLSTYVDAKSLAATVAETVTVPAGAAYVVFSVTPSSANLYVRDGGTAAAPAADVSDGTASFANPSVRAVRGGQTFSVVSDATAILTLAYYGAPTGGR